MLSYDTRSTPRCTAFTGQVPKVPGEPARVQPSRMTQEAREIEGLA